jgi:hypothetical protein
MASNQINQAYQSLEDYTKNYAKNYGQARTDLENMPNMGMPAAEQALLMNQAGQAVTSQANKYGVLQSGETQTGLGNAATQIGLQSYQTQEQNVNNALNQELGLQQQDLMIQYNQAVQDQDFARAEKLQNEMIAAQNQNTNTTGMFNLAGSIFKGVASYFTGGLAGAAMSVASDLPDNDESAYYQYNAQ